MSDISPESDLAADLLIGATSIGAFLGRPRREIYGLAEPKKFRGKKRLADHPRWPIFSWGGKIAARKSALRQHIVDLEKAATS
jgi:hypothetical protein